MVNHNLTLQPGDTLTVKCVENVMDQSAIMKEEGNMSLLEGGKRSRKGANKTRKNKQEGGKRKLSGYMKFANKVRPDLMKENPGMAIPKLGSAIGAKWRALSDAEKKSYA
jgi:hypothetical protein